MEFKANFLPKFDKIGFGRSVRGWLFFRYSLSNSEHNSGDDAYLISYCQVSVVCSQQFEKQFSRLKLYVYITVKVKILLLIFLSFLETFLVFYFPVLLQSNCSVFMKQLSCPVHFASLDF